MLHRKFMILITVALALIGTLIPASPAAAQGVLIKSQGHPGTPDGLCLDVAGWSQENGAAIIQWPCHGGANQRWAQYRSSSMPAGNILLINLHSRKCIDVDQASTAPWARLIQYHCTYSNLDPQQQWQKFPCNGGAWGCEVYRNAKSRLYMDVPYNSYNWGVQLHQYPYNDTAAQHFWWGW